MGEGGGIEPLLDRSWARRIAGDVRPIRAEAVEDVPEIGGPDRDREPVLPGVDAVHLPTTDDRVLHAGSRAGVALALAEGQVPDEARHRAMVHIEVGGAVVEAGVVVV